MSKNCDACSGGLGAILDGVAIPPLDWKLAGGQWVATCGILGEELHIALAGMLWCDISEYGFFNLPSANVEDVKGQVEEMRLKRIQLRLGGRLRAAGMAPDANMDRLASHIEWLKGDHELCNPWLARDIEALVFRAEAAERREAALLASNQSDRIAQVENASLRYRLKCLEGTATSLAAADGAIAHSADATSQDGMIE